MTCQLRPGNGLTRPPDYETMAALSTHVVFACVGILTPRPAGAALLSRPRLAPIGRTLWR